MTRESESGRSTSRFFTSRSLDWALCVVSLLGFIIALWMVFEYAPREQVMGEIQRIFYFHVASAWVGFFGFFVTALGGAAFLVTGRREWDVLSLSSAEIGLGFITMTVISGMLWAKPVWGVYWTWEPRLTISAVQWLLYVSYVMLRGSVESLEREARFAAVYGVVAFGTVPLSWFAIRWWRTLHPLIISVNEMAITSSMTTTLFVSLAAFTILYLTLLRQRFVLEVAKDQRTHLRRALTRQVGG